MKVIDRSIGTINSDCKQYIINTEINIEYINNRQLPDNQLITKLDKLALMKNGQATNRLLTIHDPH